MRRLGLLPNEFVKRYCESRPQIGANICKKIAFMLELHKGGWAHDLLLRLKSDHSDYDLRALPPGRICELVEWVQALVPDMSKPEYKEFCDSLRRVFCYETASRWLKSQKDVAPYANVRYCPYCNADTVYALNIDGIPIRSDLDHFFPKDKYPFLAISIYNLIPACTRCNRSLKSNHYIPATTMSMPYRDDVHEHLSFKVIVKDVKGFFASGHYGIKGIKSDSSSDAVRALEYVKFFKTEAVYARLFAPEIADMLRRVRMARSFYRAAIKEKFKIQCFDQFLWHDIPDENDINLHRLSKLKIDIMKQFGLLV